MKNRIHSWALSACIVSATPLMMTEAAASGIVSADNIVCATIDVVACVDDTACVQGTAKNFDLPEFVIIDTKKKVIRATLESGHKNVSPIKTLESSGEHLILQGIENSRGWSLAIDTKSGDMSGSLVGEGLSFLVFGNCTTL